MSHVLVESDDGFEMYGPQFDRVELDTDDELMNVPATSGLKTVEPNGLIDMDALRCVVCKLLPYTFLCQCVNKHHLCAGCFQMRVLDKTLGSQLGTCPECNMRMFRHDPNRNFTEELMLAEIVVECEKCASPMQRAHLRKHELHSCPKRLVPCKYKRIGCNWTGGAGHALTEHELSCEFVSKKGLDLLEQLRRKDEQRQAKETLLRQIMRLTQLPHISVRLLHLLPQANSFLPNDAVASATFNAFDMRWFLLFSCTSNSDTNSSALYYQFCLGFPEDCTEPITLTYTFVSGTYSEVRFQPNIGEKFQFTHDNSTSPMHQIYRNNWHNMSKLMNERGFYGRFMFVQL